MQSDTPDRTHQVSYFISHLKHASINSGSSTSVVASANVSLVSGELAPANAITTIMPTATLNASAPSYMHVLYIMQQQINMLRQQLKYAQAHISESERHSLVTVPPQSTSTVTFAIHPAYIYVSANSGIPALPHALMTANKSSVNASMAT
uniref:Uncharacterized protein n=2 Tax=Ceratitis capitata TaxID=7213 RepID=W8B654_CERCA